MALTGLLPPGRGSLAAVHALVDGVATATGYGRAGPTRRGRGSSPPTSGPGAASCSDATTCRPTPTAARGWCARARLADAVQASCSIPGWYPPTVIDGVPYVDGGAVSICSVDCCSARRHGRRRRRGVHPGADGRRRARPADGHRGAARAPGAQAGHPARSQADAARLRAAGKRVCLLTPGPADLAGMGVNMMDPPRRTEVFETARDTAAAQLRRELAASAGWGRRA